jgi:chromosome partitioning protein
MSDSRAVSVSILKGGVGKSTIAVNLSERLAAKENNVLFIDIDPNGHASIGLGFKKEYRAGDTLGPVILEDQPPEDSIHSTEWGFDVLPSSTELETVEDQLRSVSFGDVKIRQEIVEPLLDNRYDYIVMDSPAYRGKLSDNSLVASQNVIVPLTPGAESISGFERMMERQIKPIRQQIGLDILAIVPNMLNQRIDQQTDDKQLLKELNENFYEYLPCFARISSEEWKRIDSEGYRPEPMPGLRKRNSFSQAYGDRVPLAEKDSECDQLENLDKLAEAVMQGGVGA